MQELVAGMERLRVELEADVEQQGGAQPLPFLGTWQAGTERAVVCKHWLRGLCKKGNGCGFLHGYDVTKRPECYFHNKFGECSIKDCPFLHVDTTVDNSRACPWYDRGFCRNGPSCKYKHRRRVMCANYLVGFCPEGPNCKFMHLKAGLSTRSVDPAKGAQCPRGLAHAAGGESSPEDVLAAGTTQHGAAQPRDSSSVPPQPAVAAGARHLLQVQTERSLCWQV
ncbi:putative cleavage and polyadenylation specificity factor subunit 4-like protein isoform X1 [Anas platyrhynchos]|uniref:putative cleavage and polyadenylation specificity factor subunit 4-like protein isoform X1 n=1 Tax=Anas platyrhynchos TaxID=8839 RepID=UPI0018D891BF|nr:putative cleavage and polyadenylation specificity factor subunit 4-like protein isoform X1 [Anas platyrhynchos]